jgi:hypothetical protein
VRRQAALGAARAVSELLARRGLAALFVKGVVTSGWLYAQPEDRTFDDIDLRVRPSDLDAVAQAFAAEGHFAMARRSPTGNVVFEVAGFMVDIEPTIGPPHLCRAGVDAMLRRATDGQPWLGFPASVPELHDHALLLAINIFKDHPKRASKSSVDDLRRLTELPAFSAATLCARAKEARASTILGVLVDHFGGEIAAMAAIGAELGGKRARGYRALHRLLSARPGTLPARLLSRVASDNPLDWPLALHNAAQVALWVRRDPEGATLRRAPQATSALRPDAGRKD